MKESKDFREEEVYMTSKKDPLKEPIVRGVDSPLTEEEKEELERKWIKELEKRGVKVVERDGQKYLSTEIKAPKGTSSRLIDPQEFQDVSIGYKKEEDSVTRLSWKEFLYLLMAVNLICTLGLALTWFVFGEVMLELLWVFLLMNLIGVISILIVEHEY